MTDQPGTSNDVSTLKIIGAGFGRTGTLSLKVALEMLGFAPCYHMVEVFAHPEHVALWEAATNGEALDWQAIFGAYQACLDWPSCAFYQKLVQTYPEAKVILTVRDPTNWYESMFDTIYRVSQISNEGPVDEPPLDRGFPPEVNQRFLDMVHKIIWQQTFHDRFAEKAYALHLFNQHTEEVQRQVPADRLLIYQVKEGWEPLCAFLGVEVPQNTPFPHLNDRASFPPTPRP